MISRHSLALGIFTLAALAQEPMRAETPVKEHDLHAGAEGSSKPNIVIIIADDLGFSDIGAYGSEIETPNLDALAEAGLRYTSFYNAGRCWPTRTCLMSGYYEGAVRREGKPFKADVPMFPQQLKQAGYRSYHSGKFHVKGADNPMKAGFDRSYFTPRLDVSFFSPSYTVLDGKRLPRPDPHSGYHVTDAIGERAIEFLSEHESQHKESPFFLYLAHFAPHWPLHAHQEDIDKYRGRYDMGWDQLRERRLSRLKEMGLLDVTSTPIDMDQDTVPSWNLRGQALVDALGAGEVGTAIPWDRLNEEQQAFQSEKMAIHAAMVHHMDRSIGLVIEKLKAMGEFENTIICFMSDNGASAELLVRRHDKEAVPGTHETYLSMGPGWATAANTPFRLHKHYMYEGGIATPLIVHWPAGIHDEGGIRNTPGHVIDLMPTMLELAGVDALSEFNGSPVSGIQGKSLVESFASDKNITRPFLFFEHSGHQALRNNDWKIVHNNHEPWELYNMKNDRAETTNVAREFPELLSKMIGEYKAFQKTCLNIYNSQPPKVAE